MKAEVDVLGFPSLIVLVVSVDVKQRILKLPDPKTSEFRSCVKVEVDVLGSASLMVRMVSVNLNHYK